jgi:FMN reductase
LRLVTVAADLRPASGTLAVATAASRAVAQAAGLAERPQTVDLCVLARRLLLPEPSPAIEEAIEVVSAARLLVVASPTVSGTYTGLLKVFLDRLPHQALDGALALPLLVMSSGRHATAVDAHLRPLLAELGAMVPVPGLAVLDADLARPGGLDSLLRPWAAAAAAAAAIAAPSLVPLAHAV